MRIRSLVDTCHRFTRKMVALLATEGGRVRRSKLQHQIMQRGGLGGVRGTPPPTRHQPTTPPRPVCFLARHYRAFTAGRTGLPNTDTVSGLPSAQIWALITLLLPKSRPSCFIIQFSVHTNFTEQYIFFHRCTVNALSCKLFKE